MKAIFAWLSLLACLANVFAVASGKPEEPPAVEKISGLGVQDLGTAAGLGTAMDIGPAGKLPIEPENELETGKLIKEFEELPIPMAKAINLERAKGSILDNDLATARYVANPEKVLEQILSEGEAIPEIKQGKIIAGDPAELDVLTLKHRRGVKCHECCLGSKNPICAEIRVSCKGCRPPAIAAKRGKCKTLNQRGCRRGATGIRKCCPGLICNRKRVCKRSSRPCKSKGRRCKKSSECCSRVCRRRRCK